MNIPVGIIDENGEMRRTKIPESLLSELVKKINTKGMTSIHTAKESHKAQAIIVMAKDCEGKMLFIPDSE